MDADGGKSKHAANKGGAKYGTGYCDAQVRFRCTDLARGLIPEVCGHGSVALPPLRSLLQCPHDIKFINGEANMIDWTPSPTDPNAGTGKYGSCCVEMDIWEANSISTAYTAHSCSVTEQARNESNSRAWWGRCEVWVGSEFDDGWDR